MISTGKFLAKSLNVFFILARHQNWLTKLKKGQNTPKPTSSAVRKKRKIDHLAPPPAELAAPAAEGIQSSNQMMPLLPRTSAESEARLPPPTPSQLLSSEPKPATAEPELAEPGLEPFSPELTLKERSSDLLLEDAGFEPSLPEVNTPTPESELALADQTVDLAGIASEVLAHVSKLLALSATEPSCLAEAMIPTSGSKPPLVVPDLPMAERKSEPLASEQLPLAQQVPKAAVLRPTMAELDQRAALTLTEPPPLLPDSPPASATLAQPTEMLAVTGLSFPFEGVTPSAGLELSAAGSNLEPCSPEPMDSSGLCLKAAEAKLSLDQMPRAPAQVLPTLPLTPEPEQDSAELRPPANETGLCRPS